MRDEFSLKVLDILARNVGLDCSNPGCRRPTTGPRTDPERNVCIGVGAHITAASRGGPRFDEALTPEERASAANGVWLCQNCAKLVDNDPARYTAALLREWKRDAEAEQRTALEGTPAKRPQYAVELVLIVGGVVVGGPEPVRTTPNGKGYASGGWCNRHEYELELAVRNTGDERLAGYHVDVEFPAVPLENPATHCAFMRERSTPERAFFRASGALAPELFPGDGPIVLSIPYVVDEARFRSDWRRPEPPFYAEPVRVTLYRPGLQPLTVERPFKDFSNY